jgi:hypothetical protein
VIHYSIESFPHDLPIVENLWIKISTTAAFQATLDFGGYPGD